MNEIANKKNNELIKLLREGDVFNPEIIDAVEIAINVLDCKDIVKRVALHATDKNNYIESEEDTEVLYQKELYFTHNEVVLNEHSREWDKVLSCSPKFRQVNKLEID